MTFAARPASAACRPHLRWHIGPRRRHDQRLGYVSRHRALHTGCPAAATIRRKHVGRAVRAGPRGSDDGERLKACANHRNGHCCGRTVSRLFERAVEKPARSSARFDDGCARPSPSYGRAGTAWPDRRSTPARQRGRGGLGARFTSTDGPIYLVSRSAALTSSRRVGAVLGHIS